jgi:hypothetical protein
VRLPERVAGGAAAALLILLLAGPPWPSVRRDFAAGHAWVMNGLFAGADFGKGGRVYLQAGDRSRDGRQPAGEVSVDTVLEVSVVGYRGSLVQGLNARRDAYLPLLVAIAAAAAIPVRARRKLRLVGIAAGLETVVILAAMGFFLVWDLAIGLGLRGVYDLASWQKTALDLIFRTWLLPPANRLAIPLGIAAVLAWRSLRPAAAAKAGPPGR